MGTKEGGIYLRNENFSTGMLSALNDQSVSSYIIRMYDKSFSLLRSGSQKWYMFDSHVVRDGVAGVVVFNNCEEAVQFLEKRLIADHDEQVDVVPIHVLVLAQIDVEDEVASVYLSSESGSEALHPENYKRSGNSLVRDSSYLLQTT